MLESHPINVLSDIPSALLEIPEPPEKLFIRGKLPSESFVYLGVVGSRRYTPYGKEACRKIISELRGHSVAIVSGLALGIDSIAHEEALNAGLPTIAIPGSGLSEKVLHPKTHLGLAKRILDKGGCILSEYPNDQSATLWTFPRRNRIMAGISKAMLVVEAESKSGTMISARLATEYNRDVLTIPGSIFSATSTGTNLLLRLGATPVASGKDVLDALGLKQEEKVLQEKLFEDCSAEEMEIIRILESPKSRDEICDESDISAQQIGSLLTILEIKGLVKESLGKMYLA